MRRSLLAAALPAWRRVGDSALKPRAELRLRKEGAALRGCASTAGTRPAHGDAGNGANRRGPVQGEEGMKVGGVGEEGGPHERKPLYDSHVPTTLLEKVLLAGRAAFGALRDPERADLVADLGDTTGAPALERMRAQMLASETGRLILAERPRVAERAPLELVAACAPGTFGRAYHDFMASHGFRPESRPPVRYVDDPELAYVMLRFREVKHRTLALERAVARAGCGAERALALRRGLR